MEAKKSSKKNRHIRFRPSLFWDVDPQTVNPNKHARYIIARILEFGRDNEVRWLWNAYPTALIRDVVKKSRVLRPRTKVLWEVLTRAR
ncbi:MAG: hypothetical protein A2672_00560 [Candidatus Wildermuthbacteria bacterium RIFCSPHIGHO2_01_FULL_49_22b]|uniref:DUF6922 domain-containing protein n=1 Tax=Candidatus Wildermuthbacteria bacterium RIFCSPHIGHO2_01_FULL_49_22b TaxID=1802448 RepID=A0A1G2R0K7_9BACT|nr:MAG: hypothetical protein A2672_00560 [Candidatus Wildermuthbacteria bacterium RIFCSPHIGHO2_01_FULL_49_22b]